MIENKVKGRVSLKVDYMSPYGIINNPKEEALRYGFRVKSSCTECHRKAYHLATCSHATMADAREALEHAEKRINYLGDKAATWCSEITKLHGKIAMQKIEIYKLRARLKKLQEESKDENNH